MRATIMYRAGDVRVVGIEGVPDGYRAMDHREAIKVMIKP